MITVTDEFKEKCLNFEQQNIKCTIGGTLEVDSSDIATDGLEIDYSSQSTGVIELGSMMSTVLNLTLINSDKFNEYSFVGKTVEVEISYGDTDDLKLNLGTFTIDSADKNSNTISIVAFDSMINFDKVADVTYPITVSNLINQACTDCGVTLKAFTTAPANINYEISNSPMATELTYRQLISWCGQIIGKCACINTDGELEFKWYTSTDETITGSQRFDSSISDTTIKVSGVKYGDILSTDNDDSYSIDLSANLLIQNNVSTVLNNIWNSIESTCEYTPFSAEIIPMMWIQPFDTITFVDLNGNEFTCNVTNYNYVSNGRNAISSEGSTDIEKVEYSESVNTQISQTLISADQINTGVIKSVNTDPNDGAIAKFDLNDSKLIVSSRSFLYEDEEGNEEDHIRATWLDDGRMIIGEMKWDSETSEITNFNTCLICYDYLFAPHLEKDALYIGPTYGSDCLVYVPELKVKSLSFRDNDAKTSTIVQNGSSVLLTNNNGDTALKLKSHSTSTYIGFHNSGGTELGYLGVNSSKKPVFYDTADHVLAYADHTHNVNDLTLDSWVTVTFSGSNYSNTSGYTTQYRQVHKRVEIRGTVDVKAAGTIFTLPAGYRLPSGKRYVYFAPISISTPTGAYGIIRIDSNGTVNIVSMKKADGTDVAFSTETARPIQLDCSFYID